MKIIEEIPGVRIIEPIPGTATPMWGLPTRITAENIEWDLGDFIVVLDEVDGLRVFKQVWWILWSVVRDTEHLDITVFLPKGAMQW